MKDRDTNQSYSVRNVRETQTSLRSGSHVFTDVEQKSEKIVTAIYMVTDCIEKEDPIKDMIRQMSVKVLSEIHSMSLMSESESHTSLTRSTHFIERLLSFLALSVNVGYVSDMNFLVLENALNFLKDELEKRQNAFVSGRAAGLLNRRQDVENFQLPTNLFEDDLETPADSPELKSAPQTEVKKIPQQAPRSLHTKKQSTPKVETSHIEKAVPAQEHNPFVKKFEKKEAFRKPSPSHPQRQDLNAKKRQTVESIKTYLEKKKSVPSPTSKPEKGNPRQDRLVSMIRQRRNLSVTDLKDNFPEISSKTIQRDLVALVSKGILTREGDKRWARYSMKNNNS